LPGCGVTHGEQYGQTMEDHNQGYTRRDFMKLSATVLAGASILPSKVVAGLGYPAPSDKLNIAVIGVGGVGFRNLNHLKEQNIVALCDVDSVYAEKSFRRWGDARRYKDYRLMLDQERNIDAVVIATPDHTHSVIAMEAMQRQKHVYVQSPMAHSVFEARRMVETARVFNVVTQVGNQVASGEGTRLISEIIWSGAIGEVREVHAWTSHPLWLQGLALAESRLRAPRELDWELFIGPAAMVPYHPSYTPFGWRAWWNFGNGALGSMGPHLLEPVFRAMKLPAPNSVQASSSEFSLDFAPKASKIVFKYNRRDNMPKVAMPPLKLYWYDGGLLPDRPAQLPPDVVLGDGEGGLIFLGSEAVLVCNNQGEGVKVYKNGEETEVLTEKTFHRIAQPFCGGHESDFVRACNESGENRLLPTAHFDSQLALNETILVGNMALMLQSFGRPLLWDSSQMRFSNLSETDLFSISIAGEPLNDNGIIRVQITKTEYHAIRYVERKVRPVYRQGWPQI